MSAVDLNVRVPVARRSAIPNGVLGMLVFVCTEAMFFAALISAFIIGRASAGMWPPPGQPRLPAAATAVNTLVLLASGVALVLCHRALRGGAGQARARRMLGVAIGLGAFFVVFQGVEWIRLIGYGLTVTSSTYGSFFYVIIGTHALHAVAAIAALGWVWWRMRGDRFEPALVWTAEVFWYFVVGVWPILYYLVYLS